MTHGQRLFVLGASGFIGQAVVREARTQGWTVQALARSPKSAAALRALGAEIVEGDAARPHEWIGAVDGADAMIDLVQPARAKRLTRAQIRAMSTQRQTCTRALVAALQTLDPARTPRLIEVSGIDDLAKDADGVLSAQSALRSDEYGFNTIGVPVRRIIEAAGIAASFAYLGVVYGPGGAFGTQIFPSVKSGGWKNFGASVHRMVLVHVADAARGLVRIAALAHTAPRGAAYVLVDNEPVSMPAFFTTAAQALGVRPPGSVPSWLAALVAGKPIVETTLQRERVRSSFQALGIDRLAYPMYHEGLAATLRELGMTSAQSY